MQEIDEYGFKEYKLLVANSVKVPFVDSPAPRRIHVEVPMPPEKAKEVKAQIQVMAVCKLTAPFTSLGKFHKEPTRDDPKSVNIEHHYLKVNILAIWIYNYATGAVYARIQPTSEFR